MDKQKGYIYLLRCVDEDGGILNKYGYSKKYPKERLYRWRSKLKLNFKISFIAKCTNCKKLENDIKWFVIKNNYWFLINKSHELALDSEDELREYIKSHKYFKEVVYEQ